MKFKPEKLDKLLELLKESLEKQKSCIKISTPSNGWKVEQFHWDGDCDTHVIEFDRDNDDESPIELKKLFKLLEYLIAPNIGKFDPGLRVDIVPGHKTDYDECTACGQTIPIKTEEEEE